MAEETKKDLLLKRIQIVIAIAAGTLTVVIGAYNLKKTVFSETSPGHIAAVVRSHSGSPVAGAQVQLLNAQNALVASSVTDSQGAYSRKELAPGSYSLRVTKPGFESELVTLNVEPKKTSDFQIILKGGPGAPIRSAIEEVGASWIKKLGKPKADAENNESSQS